MGTLWSSEFRESKEWVDTVRLYSRRRWVTAGSPFEAGVERCLHLRAKAFAAQSEASVNRKIAGTAWPVPLEGKEA